MRVKKFDALLTFKEVVKWHVKEEFNICGCILFLLFLKAGCTLYPNFDTEMINLALESSERCKSGWNEAYDNLTVKYSRELDQTGPSVPSKAKGKFLGGPTKVEKKVSRQEAKQYYEEKLQRKKQRTNPCEV